MDFARSRPHTGTGSRCGAALASVPANTAASEGPPRPPPATPGAARATPPTGLPGLPGCFSLWGRLRGVVAGVAGRLLLLLCDGELRGSAGNSSPVDHHSQATGAANPRAPSQDRAKTADDLIRSQHARMVLPDRVVIQVQSRWGAPAELLPILSDIVLRGISRFAGSSNALVSWVPPLTTDKIAPVFRGSFRFTSLNQRLEPLRSIRSAADGPQRVLGAHDHGSRGDSRSGHQRLVHHVLRHELEGGSSLHHEDVAVLAGQVDVAVRCYRRCAETGALVRDALAVHLAAARQVVAVEDPGVAQGVKVLAVDERCRDVRAALLLLPSDLGAAGDVAACAAADDENGGFGAPPAGHHDQAIGVGRRGRGNLRTASQPPQLFPGGGVITPDEVGAVGHQLRARLAGKHRRSAPGGQLVPPGAPQGLAGLAVERDDEGAFLLIALHDDPAIVEDRRAGRAPLVLGGVVGAYVEPP